MGISFARISLKIATVIGVFVSTALFLGSSVGAVASDPKMFISADNTFYAYAKAGEKISVAFEKTSQIEPGGLAKHDVAVSLEGPGLTTQTCTISKDVAVGKGCSFSDVVAPQTGVYRIGFRLPNGALPYPEVSPQVKWGGNLFSWNVTVKEGGSEKTGRVWSELYAVRQPVPESYLANLTYHYVSESGHVYRAAYKGYNGQISTFSADAVGIRQGDDCVSAYRSVSVDDKKYVPSFGECGGSYKLFFEQPAGELPKTATKWDGKGTEWIIPTAVSPKVSELRFESDKNGDMQSGKITFKLTNYVGQYSVDIDTTGDGGFSSKEDVSIKRSLKKLDNGTQEVTFDGVDARGQVVAPMQPIFIRVNVEKVAEIHLVNGDVEGRTGGLELTRLSGENAPSSRMCWNDTDLSPLVETTLQTKDLDGRSCPDSSVGKLHGWPYATGSWGDGRYIDDWAYATARVEGITKIQYPDSVEPVTSAAESNRRATTVVGAIVVTAVFIGLVTFFVIRRRRHAKSLRNASQYQQPIDFPGPGDPRPPQL